jgi:hypothetical protein
LFETGDDARYGQIRTKKAGDIQLANKMLFVSQLNGSGLLGSTGPGFEVAMH